MTPSATILILLSIMAILDETHEETEGIDETYDIDESFPMLMATCVKYMRETLNARFTEQGYTTTTEQWMLLTMLSDQDGVSQLELAKRSDKTEVSTLNLLKKLEASGFVMRQPDLADRRSNRVYLTSEGRKFQRALIPSAKANIVRMSIGLESEDIESLKRILRHITRNLKA